MNFTRRELLLAGAALPAFAKIGDPAPVRILAQSYVFLQDLEKRKKNIKDSQDEVFGTLAKAGYKQVELVSEFLTRDTLPKTEAALKKYNLQSPVIYMNGILHEINGAGSFYYDVVAMAERVQKLGVKAVTLNPLPKPKHMQKTDSELRIQGEYINRIATTLQRANIEVRLHHHDGEMAENAREFKINLLRADPKMVKFCVDVAWVKRGNQDPVAILKAAGTRLSSVHLRNAVKGIWTESLGDGDIDMKAIAAYLKKAKLSPDLVVELAWDPTTAVSHSMEQNLRTSREYVEKIFG